MGREKGRAFWQRAVADVGTCGSQSAAARLHGVSQSGLGYWVRKLSAEKPLRLTAEPQLLPVRVTSPVVMRRCQLIVGELRVEFDEGTDPGYLAAVARALRAC